MKNNTRRRKLLTTRLAAAAATATMLATVVGAAPEAAAVAHAGGGIKLTDSNGKTVLCTLTRVFQPNNDHKLWGLTAGHCFGDKIIVAIHDMDGQLLAGEEELKRATVRNEDKENGMIDDYALFPFAPDAKADQSVVRSYPNHPVFQLNPMKGFSSWYGEPAKATPDMVGAIVCKDGLTTGRTCGVILDVNEDGEVFAVIPALPGDSGAPLMVNDRGGKRPIGILHGGSPILFNSFDSMPSM